jgi:nicotinate-nucleotide adenylyltransferase
MGHLVAASEVHTALNLDKVVFVPAGDPWQKSHRIVTDAQDRLAMVKLAVAEDERFSVSDAEIMRQGPTYSIDTVLQWHETNPEDELFWIVGADALVRISSWHRWDEFVEKVTIVCVNRAGVDMGSEDVTFEYLAVNMPQVRISATELRTRFAAGVNSRYLVPDAVLDYVAERRLYA